jgi:uncharacterized Zn finger protein
MDTGKGKFKEFQAMEELENLKQEFPKHGGIFKVGEIVELKGSRFRVKSIKPTELRLKLLPKNQ